MSATPISIEAVRAFIAEEAKRLHAIHKNDLERLQLTVRDDFVRVWSYGTRGDDRYAYRFGDGQTFEAAIADLLNKMENRPGKVAELRDQARELLRRAAEMEKGLAQ